MYYLSTGNTAADSIKSGSENLGSYVVKTDNYGNTDQSSYNGQSIGQAYRSGGGGGGSGGTSSPSIADLEKAKQLQKEIQDRAQKQAEERAQAKAEQEAYIKAKAKAVKKETAEQQALILSYAQTQVKATSKYEAIRASRLAEEKAKIKEPTETTAYLQRGRAVLTGTVAPAKRYPNIVYVDRVKLDIPIPKKDLTKSTIEVLNNPLLSNEVRQSLEQKPIQQTSNNISFTVKEQFKETIRPTPKTEIRKEIGAGVRKGLQEKPIQQTTTGQFYEPTEKAQEFTFIQKINEEIPEIKLILGGFKEVAKYSFGVGADIREEGLFPKDDNIKKARLNRGNVFISNQGVQTVGLLGAITYAPTIIQYGVAGVFYTREVETFIQDKKLIRGGVVLATALAPKIIKKAKKVYTEVKQGVKKALFTEENIYITKIPNSPFIMDRRLPYLQQYELKRVLTERGKQIGIELVLKKGQQKFSSDFSSPNVKVGITERGEIIEIGRPRPNYTPKEKNVALKDVLPNTYIEFYQTPNIKTRLNPIDYAKFEASKGKLYYDINSISTAFLKNPKLQGGYWRNTYPSTIATKPKLTYNELKTVTAHELIHYKQSDTLLDIAPLLNRKVAGKILGERLGNYISYRSQPSEILAFAKQNYYTKVGFKADLGAIKVTNFYQPFMPEKLPQIPTMKIKSSKQINLNKYGFQNPLTKKVNRAIKKPFKPTGTDTKTITSDKNTGRKLIVLTQKPEVVNKQVTILRNKPEVVNKQATKLIVFPIIKQKEKEKQKFYQTTYIKTNTNQAQDFKLNILNSQLIKTMPYSNLISVIKVDTSLKENIGTSTIDSTKIDYIEDISQVSKYDLDIKIDTIEKEIIEETTIKDLKFKKKAYRKQEEKGKGYNVYVRERGRDIKVNKKVLPYNKALNLGAEVADNTPSVTFKLKKAQAKNLEQDDATFLLKNKFEKRSYGYVEQNTFRIDSEGERQGITVRGWLANKRKANFYYIKKEKYKARF